MPLSRLSLEPASCMAAMAEAATTPETVPPLETSRLPVTSLSSLIFPLTTDR